MSSDLHSRKSSADVRLNESLAPAKLILQDGTVFSGRSFGAPVSVAGEAVFNTGMVGYPEALTDPSYRGQILILTYPLVGNYGVPGADAHRPPVDFESVRVQLTALIVADRSPGFSHWHAEHSLDRWLQREGVPALTGVDTRALVRHLREKGTMPAKVLAGPNDMPFEDPNERHLAAEVSEREPRTYGESGPLVVLVNCGCKAGILRQLLARGVRVKTVPWDYDFTVEEYDGLLLSNGPGNPVQCAVTIGRVRTALRGNKPLFGICLGHQLLALAAGMRTYKLPYGHRGQNQPVRRTGTERCFVTSQNHSFAVNDSAIPEDWEPMFVNLNDGTNEGLRHKDGRFFSVQFHPEAAPGPSDTAFLFDDFVRMVKGA